METSGSRSDYLDSAKGVAILAVVLGHIASPLANFLFAWHMPFFFVVAGVFIRPQDDPRAFAHRNIQRLLYPYLIFGVLGAVAEIVKRLALDRPVGDLADYVTGLLFWMDYSHLTGYHHVLWFLPALFVARMLVYAIAKSLRSVWPASTLVIALAAIGLSLPQQMPFVLNQALIALPWTWVGYLCFNQARLRYDAHTNAYFAVAALGVCLYALSGIPTLNLGSNSLPVPPHNYVFATLFALLLISIFACWRPLSRWEALRVWGMNSMLILVAHPYTNNIAYLIVERWLGGLWYFKFGLSVFLLYAVLRVKLHAPRAFPFRFA